MDLFLSRNGLIGRNEQLKWKVCSILNFIYYAKFLV